MPEFRPSSWLRGIGDPWSTVRAKVVLLLGLAAKQGTPALLLKLCDLDWDDPGIQLLATSSHHQSPTLSLLRLNLASPPGWSPALLFLLLLLLPLHFQSLYFRLPSSPFSVSLLTPCHHLVSPETACFQPAQLSTTPLTPRKGAVLAAVALRRYGDRTSGKRAQAGGRH